MSILSLRLVNGDDVVGDVSFDEISNEYVVENPVQLIVVPNGSVKEPSFGFVPYPIHADRPSKFILKFSKSHVILSCELASEFVNQYNSMYGSGIITPSKGIVV